MRTRDLRSLKIAKMQLHRQAASLFQETHNRNAQCDETRLHNQSVQAALVLQFRDQVRRGEIDKTARREAEPSEVVTVS
jgi:hypothetical protein